MRVLVTGGTGFVGRNLVYLLCEKGYDVTILHREVSRLHDLPKNVSYRVGDVTQADSIKGCCEGMDYVFHVAGIVRWGKASRAKLKLHNVTGTRNIALEALQRGVKKFVHTSSAAAVCLPEKEMADETFAFNGDRLQVGYAIAKKAGEEIVLRLVEKGLPATVVNPSVIIGRRNYSNHFVRSVIKGRLTVSPAGGINVCDVDDVAEGYLLAALHGKVGERYLLAGTNLPLKELFQKIARASGRNGRIYLIPTPLIKGVSWIGEAMACLGGSEPFFAWDLAKLSGRNIYYSSDKARQELGYRITPLEETIRKVVEWEKQLERNSV
ncbi:NAD-dependent epimerase/dehydratase family protein [Thermoactinomyces mirandus]|uniref:NAD-dependent epimerase/dehydratase family protein n=1 Tax=Thermoactinomyces mirandus TaxID=2756294 RepID=A0A7W2AQ37_9BACL|nr:NAD-dependent epimerase/dehydratase family protein [Thermoactinomyces mirandus]MBA4600877.1 NAD-dependent epimerase/dehydratase family protein [Thermoactinomyces mirandus]